MKYGNEKIKQFNMSVWAWDCEADSHWITNETRSLRKQDEQSEKKNTSGTVHVLNVLHMAKVYMWKGNLFIFMAQVFFPPSLIVSMSDTLEIAPDSTRHHSLNSTIKNEFLTVLKEKRRKKLFHVNFSSNYTYSNGERNKLNLLAWDFVCRKGDICIVFRSLWGGIEFLRGGSEPRNYILRPFWKPFFFFKPTTFLRIFEKNRRYCCRTAKGPLETVGMRGNPFPVPTYGFIARHFFGTFPANELLCRSFIRAFIYYI